MLGGRVTNQVGGVTQVIVEAKSNSVTTAKSVKELSEVSFELAKQESEESGEEDSDEDDDGGAGAGGGAGGGAGAGAEEGGRRSVCGLVWQRATQLDPVMR